MTAHSLTAAISGAVIDLTGFGVPLPSLTLVPSAEQADDRQRFREDSTNTAEADGLKEAQEEIGRLHGALAQAQADLAALRQRHARDHAARIDAAQDAALTLLLPLADDLDRALAYPPQPAQPASVGTAATAAADVAGGAAVEAEGVTAEAEGVAAWVQGIALIAARLHALLAQHALVAIPALGQPFDPQQHDAVAHQPSDQPSAADAPPTVTAIVRAGYTRHGRVLRPAQVQVAGPLRARPMPVPASASPAAPAPWLRCQGHRGRRGHRGVGDAGAPDAGAQEDA